MEAEIVIKWTFFTLVRLPSDLAGDTTMWASRHDGQIACMSESRLLPCRQCRQQLAQPKRSDCVAGESRCCYPSIIGSVRENSYTALATTEANHMWNSKTNYSMQSQVSMCLQKQVSCPANRARHPCSISTSPMPRQLAK